MIRILRRQLCRFAEVKDKEKDPIEAPKEKKEQYLVIPTKIPIFPYYVYSAQLNKHLYEYITRNQIKYCAAFQIQPGVYKKSLKPFSRQNLEQ